MSLPSPLALLVQSWQLYRRHLWSLVKLIVFPSLLTILLVATMALLIVLAASFSSWQWPILVPTFIIGLVAVITVSILGYASLVYFLGHTSDYLGILPLWRAVWPLIGKLWLTQLLTGLITTFGFILLIVPGIIFLTRYVFVPFIVILDHKSGREALAYSTSLVKGRFWAIFGRGLAISLFSWVLSFLVTQIDQPIIVGLLQIIFYITIGPLTTIYFYHLYQASKLEVDDLASRRPAPAANA